MSGTIAPQQPDGVARKSEVPRDELFISVNGVTVSGWEYVTLTRGVERCVSSFVIALTEKFVGLPNLLFRVGDTCTIKLGGDLALTGFIDSVSVTGSANEHSITISGRSRCADLIDCAGGVVQKEGSSVDLSGIGSQRSGVSILALAKEFAAPFGIEVTSMSGDGIAVLPFTVDLVESPYSLIERIARTDAMLVYDGPDGNLILSRAGEERHSGGFRQGINIERWSANFSTAERFSHYLVINASLDPMTDTAPGSNVYAVSTDPLVKRFRPMIIIAENAQNKVEFAQMRGQWEANRRLGRGSSITITTPGWRDGVGKLWTPNNIVSINLPASKIENVSWVITEVTYNRDLRSGTTTTLTCYPPAALNPQPIVLSPTDFDKSEHAGDAPAPPPRTVTRPLDRHD